MPSAAFLPVRAAPEGPPAAPAQADPLPALVRSLAGLRSEAALPLLAAALEALNSNEEARASALAAEVVAGAPDCALGWHVRALCRERTGDLNGALADYEAALERDPDNPDLANDLGRLAMHMGLYPVAEALFRNFIVQRPQAADGWNNLACALREQLLYEEAVAILKPAIAAHPQSPLLWNTLAAVQAEAGEVEGALIFLDEALRLAPGFAKARYNRANIRLALGDAPAALADCETAIATGGVAQGEASMMRFARATMLAAAGRLGEAWDAYEARLHPRHADVTHFVAEAPAWTPRTPLEGLDLLVFGEQGLGDEVLFANLLPDLLEALGPCGRLTLAVEPRLVPLFARSFPAAVVGAHATRTVEHRSVRDAPFVRGRAFGAWVPMGSLLRRFRRRLKDFPDRPAFLAPDPARVAYWRAELAALGPGPKVGLVWKSLKVASQRRRFYAPFDGWAPVLATPGVRFVNLQYGDCAAEVEHAREALGVEVWTPPGLDLKDDLDGVAALAAALDAVVGPANASLNLAAACGTPSWFVCPPGAWPMLGTGRYPFYPRARVFSPPAPGRWEPVMQEIAAALREAGPGPADPGPADPGPADPAAP